MRDNFEIALAEVLRHEGGWADHPSDPGGATMKGITIGTFSRYRRRDVSKAELRAISDADVRTIYRGEYWDKVRGDDLPAGLDLAVFDFAVNSGPRRAIVHLQRTVGVKDDGVFGPGTLAAVAKRDAATLVRELCSGRMRFLRALPTWKTFGKGWTRRVQEVEAAALRMAAAPVSRPVAPAAPAPQSTPVPDFPAAAAPPAWLAWLLRLFTGKGA
jgi:lysozyme family protein